MSPNISNIDQKSESVNSLLYIEHFRRYKSTADLRLSCAQDEALLPTELDTFRPLAFHQQRKPNPGPVCQIIIYIIPSSCNAKLLMTLQGHPYVTPAMLILSHTALLTKQLLNVFNTLQLLLLIAHHTQRARTTVMSVSCELENQKSRTYINFFLS